MVVQSLTNSRKYLNSGRPYAILSGKNLYKFFELIREVENF